MPEFHILHPQRPQEKEELMLVGFRVDASHDGPQLYTLLVVGGQNERPPVAAGRIIFFTRPDLAEKALTLDESLSRLGPVPQEIETFCDLAEALYLVNSQNADPDGVILDCLLILDDLVRASQLHMPERYQSILTELAARLTERADLRRIFTNDSLRRHVEDALLWCVGALAVKGKVLTE
jgi:hypothetical protein